MILVILFHPRGLESAVCLFQKYGGPIRAADQLNWLHMSNESWINLCKRLCPLNFRPSTELLCLSVWMLSVPENCSRYAISGISRYQPVSYEFKPLWLVRLRMLSNCPVRMSLTAKLLVVTIGVVYFLWCFYYVNLFLLSCLSDGGFVISPYLLIYGEMGNKVAGSADAYCCTGPWPSHPMSTIMYFLCPGRNFFAFVNVHTAQLQDSKLFRRGYFDPYMIKREGETSTRIFPRNAVASFMNNSKVHDSIAWLLVPWTACSQRQQLTLQIESLL